MKDSDSWRALCYSYNCSILLNFLLLQHLFPSGFDHPALTETSLLLFIPFISEKDFFFSISYAAKTETEWHFSADQELCSSSCLKAVPMTSTARLRPTSIAFILHEYFISVFLAATTGNFDLLRGNIFITECEFVTEETHLCSA